MELRGGPATSDPALFPPQAGRGPTTFADRQQPQIVNEHGHDVLTLRLLGLLGDRTADDDRRSLTYYRDESSSARVSLTVSGRYDLANVRYTLTGIDMVLGAPADEPCDPAAPAEPNNPTCGGSFIDRVTILSSGGRNVYAPVDPARISLVGDVITARFADTDNSGRPDAMVDGRVPVTSTAGNVQVFHPTDIGRSLQFDLHDSGEGLDADPDGRHDFDAAQQSIGLASGITFDLIALPEPTPDPNLTSIEGLIYGDANGDGVQGADEAGLPGVTVALYGGDGIDQRQIMTTTTGTDGATLGSFRLAQVAAGAPGGAPYRVEARLTMPPVVDGVDLNPIRLIRQITPTVAGPNVVDFAAWPHAVDAAALDDAATLRAAGFLVPDLRPLTTYPLPDELSPEMKADVARGYPGLEAWYLDTTSQPGKVLLRFGTLALNQGAGPLHILGGAVDGDARPVFQRIYTAGGAFIERPVAVFVQHQGHDHVHVAAFELYNLRDLETDEVVAASPKVSFCLTDVLWSIEPALTAAAPVATVPMGWNCGQYEQSINVGFSDYYGPALADQWIDITDVPDGRYRLEVVIDPEGKFLEADTSNNTVSIEVEIDNPLR
ncbi:MAG: lysyl oxidase family protein [Caldilineaceae bacterium]